MSWTAALMVFVGGGLGSLLRFSAQFLVAGGQLFPWATLGINIAGSFAIGLVWAAHADTHWFLDWGRYLLVVGVLGGFTTFSTFSLDTLLLYEQGRLYAAAGYATASLLSCVLAVYVGHRLLA